MLSLPLGGKLGSILEQLPLPYVLPCRMSGWFAVYRSSFPSEMSETRNLYSYDIKTENGYFIIAVSDLLTRKNTSFLNLLEIKDGFHLNLIFRKIRVRIDVGFE